MSSCAKGILYFGFKFFANEDDNTPSPWEKENKEWETFYQNKKGVFWPKQTNDKEGWKAWNTDSKALMEKEPCLIDFQGGSESFALFVSIKEAHLKVWEGEEEKVTCLQAKPEWIQQLKDFCQIMEIDWQEPAWYLTCSYG